MPRVRADLLLVERGLADSRESAQRLIMAGRARTGTRVLVKPATLLDPDADLTLVAPERYVSRGGHKLDGALEAFAIDVSGRACLDLGASTGGFTDCLLQRGAATLTAVDVGRAQLHARLRADPRVTLLEGINARDLPPLPPVEFFVADLSFISLRLVLPSVASRLAEGTEGLVLLKPQFEVGRPEVPRGGVIRDHFIRERVLADFRSWVESAGFSVLGAAPSVLAGGDGNQEHFVWLRTPLGEGGGSC